MADAGIGEAAILAAAAETAAAAGTTAAATLPEVLGTAAAAAGTTAAAAAPEVAAATVPALALAAPEAAAVAAPEVVAPIAAAATDVPAVSGGLLGPAAGETSGFLGAAAEQPASVSLLATESEPVTGGLLGQGAAEYPLPGSAADFSNASFASQDIGFGAGNVAPGWAGETLPPGTGLPSTTSGIPTSSLLDKLGMWWDKATLGEKLSAGGKALGGVGSVAKATTPSTPQKGPTTTIRPGTTGKPQGGEQALAAVVEALLKRRDAYTGAQYGVPVAYRPRGLLG